jgi:hypothetical protein
MNLLCRERLFAFHGPYVISIAYEVDSEVRELATVFLLWQQCTETSIWFDNVVISAFHSCVVEL